ncbi:hypothetical protein COW36_18145 [bacterium (Candidatus Blackallbacteria) CG17_big_fil_post_rev_8_21_14_2_50_48_46]|uniref:Uncharacterized protein n=1 Tax=bacterium (Candidatus Blackallbacteria) CG17_big_fil_post_rev_8_21_14_2_50_48_46 TaxID=2014261 RepID=A0A2M7G1C3_9BACT|nr:MAG: hypothetical protein COW64_00585 [bacterium (Candidatus Blackallbacteria) CG18_big_fil_WC_8_21_14_2_50_49_26]PIW15337.1 MAG: hypothetical protein COW36_18145 [bacterium (Candidatus Blackallbacteria) CG17_big_fil_post_rev_8_21_14_2_50_48_46]PIW49802.1 MAG: hypothetical protein COW20_05220 [bacterium (Candidatus Blackallbacteria) CG13_big_fil_rev_8_21_14_2_50_49_14]
MIQKKEFPPFPEALEPELERLCRVLENPEAFDVADPYWPKWQAVWWPLAFLLETGQLSRLSQAVFERFATLIDQHYLHHFPQLESELPAGCDPYRQIICHCALGTAIQIVQAGGLDPWRIWPWLSEWFSHYQLPDGGYNCDEQVYTHSQRASLVSTLPMLEALLLKPERNAQEETLLKKGLDSLLRRKLYQSSQGAVIDPLWLQPLFPRFYHYDLLRALKFVLRWHQQQAAPLPLEVLEPALVHLRAETGCPTPQSWYPGQDKTLALNAEGAWKFGAPVTLFPLLAAFLEGGYAQAWIAWEWQEVERLLG